MIDPMLRGAADDRARSPVLAARLIAALPKRPSMLMLGAPSWPLLCWLAPRIGRAQIWRIVDEDDESIDEAFEHVALWAEDRGLTVTWPKRAMLVHLPGGAWRLEGVVGGLAQPDPRELRHADAMVGEGIVKLLPTPWLYALAEAYHGPLFLTLTETGPATVLPLAPSVGLPRAHDARAGVAVIGRLTALLSERGDTVATSQSQWTVRGDELALQRVWIDAAVRAARAAQPRADERIADWAELRGRQMMRGRLQIRQPSLDFLAMPKPR